MNSILPKLALAAVVAMSMPVWQTPAEAMVTEEEFAKIREQALKDGDSWKKNVRPADPYMAEQFEEMIQRFSNIPEPPPLPEPPPSEAPIYGNGDSFGAEDVNPYENEPHHAPSENVPGIENISPEQATVYMEEFRQEIARRSVPYRK